MIVAKGRPRLDLSIQRHVPDRREVGEHTCTFTRLADSCAHCGKPVIPRAESSEHIRAIIERARANLADAGLRVRSGPTTA